MTVLTADRRRQEPARISGLTDADGSLELGQRDGLAARMADAAMQSVLHHHGPHDVVGPAPVQPDDVRTQLSVLPTGAAPAEATGAKGGLLAGPAVHAEGYRSVRTMG